MNRGCSSLTTWHAVQSAIDKGLFSTTRSGKHPGPPKVDAILTAAQQLASALTYLHERHNITHGDLTGGNVLLTASSSSPSGLACKARRIAVPDFLAVMPHLPGWHHNHRGELTTLRCRSRPQRVSDLTCRSAYVHGRGLRHVTGADVDGTYRDGFVRHSHTQCACTDCRAAPCVCLRHWFRTSSRPSMLTCLSLKLWCALQCRLSSWPKVFCRRLRTFTHSASSCMSCGPRLEPGPVRELEPSCRCRLQPANAILLVAFCSARSDWQIPVVPAGMTHTQILAAVAMDNLRPAFPADVDPGWAVRCMVPFFRLYDVPCRTGPFRETTLCGVVCLTVIPSH